VTLAIQNELLSPAPPSCTIQSRARAFRQQPVSISLRIVSSNPTSSTSSCRKNESTTVRLKAAFTLLRLVTLGFNWIFAFDKSAGPVQPLYECSGASLSVDSMILSANEANAAWS
jgi:hypothetical protein